MKIDLDIGDTILTGKFKNKKVTVKNFGTDDNGQPTYNGGKKMLTFRIKKLMPVKGADMFEAVGDKKMRTPGKRDLAGEIYDEHKREIDRFVKVISKKYKLHKTVAAIVIAKLFQRYFGYMPKPGTNLGPWKETIQREYKMKRNRYKKIVKEEAIKVLAEARNDDYVVRFGPYSIELEKSQLYFKKNDQLVKAQRVKPTFDQKDLIELAVKVAKKQGERKLSIGNKTFTV